MTSFLGNKNILLGITGSIAAYKSADLVRRLREVRAHVRVVMTENAKHFITPLTMQAVSGYPVHDSLFDPNAEAAMGHIEFARWADIIVIAPASADLIAKLANGRADDLLTTLCLATHAPIMLAPAMNQGMWKHTLTQENLQQLKAKRFHVLETAEGSQACGDVGPGRMLEPAIILQKINEVFMTGTLSGKKVVITAGPTHEAIDPVRFISNGSSGKMGYALAQAALEAGAEVTLISGPTNLLKPKRVECIDVINAQEMYDEVMKRMDNCDIFLAVAAVADYRCQTIAKQKIHKTDSTISLTLERNPDIVTSVAKLPVKPFIVGFAAETENVIAQAKSKREAKNMDLIVANEVGIDKGIGTDENTVTVLAKNFEKTFSAIHKSKLARELIALIAEKFNKRIL